MNKDELPGGDRTRGEPIDEAFDVSSDSHRRRILMGLLERNSSSTADSRQVTGSIRWDGGRVLVARGPRFDENESHLESMRHRAGELPGDATTSVSARSGGE